MSTTEHERRRLIHRGMRLARKPLQTELTKAELRAELAAAAANTAQLQQETEATS